MCAVLYEKQIFRRVPWEKKLLMLFNIKIFFTWTRQKVWLFEETVFTMVTSYNLYTIMKYYTLKDLNRIFNNYLQ